MIWRPRMAVDLARGLGLLLVLAGLLLGVRAIAPESSAESSTLIALGTIILAGYLIARLGDAVGFPHVTGYLLAGMLLGPHALAIVNGPSVQRLRTASSLSLGLIALSAGAELNFDLLRRGFRSIVCGLAAHAIVVPLVAGCALLAVARFVPFLAVLPFREQVAAAVLWGVVAMSCSASTTLGVITQVRPAGRLTRHVLPVVITINVSTLVVFALARRAAGSILDGGSAPDLAALQGLGMLLVGSLACGTTLGLAIALWLHVVKRQLLLFLLVMAHAGMQLCAYFTLEPLLLFLTAGFVVANIARHREALLQMVGSGGEIVFLVFFALAGAAVDLTLVQRLWPLAVTLWMVRGGAIILAARGGARLAGDAPVVKRFGGVSLFPQAGTTITLTGIVADSFPGLGQGFAALALAVVALNELFGPLFFKWSLDRSGESGGAAPRPETSADGVRTGAAGLVDPMEGGAGDPADRGGGIARAARGGGAVGALAPG